MTITIMNNPTALSLTEIKDSLKSPIHFKSVSKQERNEWIPALIRQHKYYKCKKKEKIILRRYMIQMTGLSKSQITRLITEYKKRGTLEPRDGKSTRNTFAKVYTMADLELLAGADDAHERLSAPAMIKIFKDDFNIFNKIEYVRLKNISPAHLYRLRQTPRYIENTRTFSKTKPTQVPIGERRKPEPNGKPGYICVDTVHQGDKDKEKGVYHINMVDMATQFEFVGATEAITERFMEPILKDLIEQANFDIIEFHSDNGGEYINKNVVKILNKLTIKLTKSRPRHCNDNPLAETKNGSVIRKHIGYNHIPRTNANLINEYYKKYFNDYLNYHRPCAFAEIKINKKGKEIKTYPKENYMTPYEKLKSIKNAKEKYLKPGVTFEQLDKIAYAMSHTEYAQMLQKEKTKLFKKIYQKSNFQTQPLKNEAPELLLTRETLPR
jgi:transposase InsO family protein